MGIGICGTGLSRFIWRYDLRLRWGCHFRCLEGQAGMASRHFGYENTTADGFYTKSLPHHSERRSNTNSGFASFLKQETCLGTQHTHEPSKFPPVFDNPLLLFCPTGPGIWVFLAPPFFRHLGSFGSVAHLHDVTTDMRRNYKLARLHVFALLDPFPLRDGFGFFCLLLSSLDGNFFLSGISL